jgi:hypothetical protein
MAQKGRSLEHARRRPRAVRAFVNQPDVYFDDGIFSRHWWLPLE